MATKLPGYNYGKKKKLPNYNYGKKKSIYEETEELIAPPSSPKEPIDSTEIENTSFLLDDLKMYHELSIPKLKEPKVLEELIAPPSSPKEPIDSTEIENTSFLLDDLKMYHDLSIPEITEPEIELPIPKLKEPEVELEESIHPEQDKIKFFEGGDIATSYYDDLDKLTGGVGHLLTPDEIAKYPEGTEIPEEVRAEWFKKDMEEAIEDTEVLLKGIEAPTEVKDIITNMSFNLGRTKLKKFKKMFKALKDSDYKEAAAEMVNSKWYKQTGRRARILAQRMKHIKGE